MSNELTIFKLMGINSPEITVIQAGQNAKAAALAASAGITAINTADDVQAVSDALAMLKQLTRTMTAEHSRVKAPVLDISRKIDAAKNDYLADIAPEERRLSLMLGAHQEGERRKAEEARRKAEAEVARIRFEAEEGERLRIADEQKGRTGTLMQDLGEIRDESAAREVAVRQAAAEASSLAPAGTAVRKSYKFEVTDIHALYKSRPELVKLEPNKAAITACIKNGAQLPGLRVWTETLASVKAAPVSSTQIVEKLDY